TREDCASNASGTGPDACEGSRRVLARVVGGGFETQPLEARVVLDTTPPGATDLSFSPPSARLDTEIFLSFNATEPLAVTSTAPAQVFEWAGADPGFADGPRVDGTRYQYRRVITSQDFTGTESFELVALELVDLVGNAARIPVNEIPGAPSFTVDTTTPTISVSLESSTERLGIGDTVRVRVVLEEDLVDRVSARVGDIPLDDCVDESGAGSFELSCSSAAPLDGTELGGAALEQALSVVATVEDEAGNRASAETQVIFDFAPPEIRAITLSQGAARAGDTVFLDVLTNEALDSSFRPTPQWDGPMPAVRTPRYFGQTVTFEYAVTATASEGTKELLEVAVRDAAGNARIARPDPAGSVTLNIDTTDPEITNFTAPSTGRRFGKTAPFNEYELGFDLSEVPADLSNLDIEVAGRIVPASSCARPSSSRFECSVVLTQAQFTAGEEVNDPVRVTVTDAAGNVSSRSTSVFLDDRVPDLTNATFTPNRAGANAQVSLLVAFDEPIAENPSLVWGPGGDPAFTPGPVSSNQAIFELDVGGGGVSDGTYTLTAVDVTDEVSNSGPVSIPNASLQVDATFPTIEDVAVLPEVGRANEDDTVEVTFEARDTHLDQVTATLGGDAMACASTGGTRYACTLSPSRPSPPTDASTPIVLSARDTFGNEATESTSIVLDFVPPEVAQASRIYVADQTNPLNQVTKAKDRTTILVTLSFTEALDGAAFAPKLTASNGTDTLDFVLQTTASDVETSATFSVVVDATKHSDGVYVPTVEIQDIAGNRNTTATFSGPDVAIEVDNTADPLVVQQDQVSYIRSPLGNADAEDLEDANGNVMYTIPSGVAFYELGPPDGLDPVDKLDADTFELAGGTTPTLLRAWADDQNQNLLGTTAPDGQGDWPREDLQLVNLDTPQVYVTGLDEAGNESDPVLIE
ncbi:MAG TPA: hypothetical protein RMG48_11065, partial [Myxococcales bacterium LLY-WYZ-16_1]|nr:hypothetical protein [Myxococcales bacterium LLY-WYZ-16_1]